MADWECGNATSYMTRKGYFAINVQVIADSYGAVLWFSVRVPGSVHDSAAFSLTHLYELMGKMESAGVHFVGDDAYDKAETREAMLCPYRHAEAPAGSGEDHYNYYQSLTRQSVERCFGMVEQRWGILQKRLLMRLKNIPLVLSTIFLLHNIALNRGDIPVSSEHTPMLRVRSAARAAVARAPDSAPTPHPRGAAMYFATWEAALGATRTSSRCVGASSPHSRVRTSAARPNEHARIANRSDCLA